jgi:hypothetical protein
MTPWTRYNNLRTPGTITDVGTVSGLSFEARSGIDQWMLKCSGSGNFTQVCDQIALPATFTAWAVPNDVVGFRRLISHDSNTSNGFTFGNHSSGKMLLTFPGVADYSFGSLDTLVSGTLYFMAVTISGNGGTAIGYLGEVAKSPLTQSASVGTPSGTPSQITIIAQGDSTVRWNGHVSDLRMYRRALSAAEIYEIWSPQHRFELFWQPSRRFYSFPAQAAAGTNINVLSPNNIRGNLGRTRGGFVNA